MSNTTEQKLYPLQVESELRLSGSHHIFRFTEKQARMIYEKYHAAFPGQSFERLHERGGFGLLEALYLLTGEHVQREDLPIGTRR